MATEVATSKEVPDGEKRVITKEEAMKYFKFNTFLVRNSKFVVDQRYQYIKSIGQGAYGVLCAAKDLKYNRKVAIKKMAKTFERVSEATRILRELRLLRHFQDHDNIVQIFDIMKPISFEEFHDVYLVTDLMETDLHQIIKSNQPLTDDHVQFFVYQILRGLKYIHSADVLHRDLKPSNLLVNSNCDLKICDFGLSRVAAPQDFHDGHMTLYVTTRWYRAPEVLLSVKEYSKAIDVWSVGCIFAELLGRAALFPGKDYMHQIQIIVDVIGTPNKDEIAKISSDRARKFLCALPKCKKRPFKALYPGANPLAIDLLEQMLKFDPAKRISVDQALAHPYLHELHDPKDEPVHERIFNFEFENVKLQQDDLRRLIYQEMLRFHPEAPQEEKIRRQYLEQQRGSTGGKAGDMSIDDMTASLTHMSISSLASNKDASMH
eukprot:GCRY01005324.1.p1 GENE.GCRY01005324.1~~GCRY01005324.1.p1  ORF type:complete len:476 (+),score=109.77 GCRY01005324.1:128-1429(+)